MALYFWRFERLLHSSIVASKSTWLELGLDGVVDRIGLDILGIAAIMTTMMDGSSHTHLQRTSRLRRPIGNKAG
jgi:hypothetical protein